jgi:imidazolonepropionase-like amidohydrolase
MMKQLTFRFFLFFSAVLAPFSKGFSQKTFPQNGVYDEREGLFAFTNATIFKSWNEKLDNATLLIRDGRIEAIGNAVTIPKEAVVLDVRGKTIYPAFIEPFGNYGMPEMPQQTQGQGGGGGGGRGAPQMLSNKKGAFSWNEALKTEFKASDVFALNEKDAEILRGVGFGAVLSHRMDGMSRGTAVMVTTANEREHSTIVKPIAAHILSFNKGTSTQNNPNSLMGGIALLRQTYLDGNWYATEGGKEERNFSLEAWNNVQSLPQIFEVSDKLEAIRAVKIANEFGKKYIIKGRGDEYQRLDAMKALNTSFILPLNFPDAYDVEDPFDALQTPLSDLKHWERAPTNAARLAKEGVEIAFTTQGLKDKKDFLKQIRLAIEAGLSEADALKAITETPAKMLGINDLGNLEKGKIANFLITSDNIFSKDAKIFHTWVNGKGYVVNDMDKPSLQGTYSFQYGKNVYKMIQVSPTGEMTVFKNDTAKVKAEVSQNRNSVTLSFTPPGEKEVVRLSGFYEGGMMRGQGQTGDGTWVTWESAPLAFTGKAETAATSPNRAGNLARFANMGEMTYPFGAYGKSELPKAERVVFKNATVWTNETDGVLQNTDVLIEGGKILQVGKNLTVSMGKTIDATGKHLTAGIIDEHSHIAISKGVNEGSQASTAEVRIADVVNSEDVNIYRQLAGGVTSSHLLHGSANPIGGQTQLIKLRWGYEPEKMKFENWDRFIKFALGENVKQSNGDIPESMRIRFPQSRMGVEQVYEDHFNRAKEYAALRKSSKTYRKDLELECLADILEKKCFITCHSYVQSEITMLLRVAEKYNVKVNTFTHILEGYKVADKMQKHGVAAAGFADWWNYKYEVYEAIPQNMAMMNQQGVLVSINSDDAEMARRLNQEAAKSMMYAGLKDEAEVFKFVTLNPAKTLHVDNRVGSIKVGKDADVVLWSDNPLSIYAKAEQTYVDGIKFFDREEDKKMQDSIRKERSRIINKMIAAKKGGAPTQPALGRAMHEYHCEDEMDEMRD